MPGAVAAMSADGASRLSRGRRHEGGRATPKQQEAIAAMEAAGVFTAIAEGLDRALAISLYRATRLRRAISLYRPTLCPSRVLSRPSGRVLSAATFHSAVLWCGLVCGRLWLLVVLELGANGVRLAKGLGVWSLRLRLWRLLLLIA
jgi:hypothetical protein